VADLTTKQGPAEGSTDARPADEIRRQAFEATGYTLTDDQLVGVARALAAGASFDQFMALMHHAFSDHERSKQMVEALDHFAKLPPEPVS
jgi:hypothetical protein